MIISAYEKNMSHIDEKVNFVEKRIEFLIKEVESTSNFPLMKCVKKWVSARGFRVAQINAFYLSYSIFMRKIDAISRHLCKTLFTESFRVDESIRKYSLIENFCMISNRALVLIWLRSFVDFSLNNPNS